MKKTLNIFALSAAILAISAALVSCQKENATPENSNPEAPAVRVIHVDLGATVAETKATYAEKVVTIQDEDQLYITLTGPESAWTATGTLTYASTSFSGDIAVTGTYEGSDPITDAKDLTATFLPKGYGSVGYLSATGEATAVNAFYAGAKSAAVPHLVHLTASITDAAGTPKSPIDLSAQNSVLCYSITANTLTAGAHTVSVSDGTTTISGSVTAVADAATTFAVAFPASATEKDYTLSITSYEKVVKNGKTLAAGKVVNVAVAFLTPLFSVSADTYVKFSPGNLQYQASTGTWRFAEHQYDYVGNASNGNVYVESTKSNNASISQTYTGWIDLFGWGTSGKTFASGYGTAYQPWATSTTDTDYGPTDGTSGLTGTYANGDWGVNMGTGWRTLTKDQWSYLFNDRTTSTVADTPNARFAKAYLFGTTHGIILFPDSYTHPDGVTAPTGINETGNTSWSANQYNATDWGKMEAAGAIFLPAAGRRSSTSVLNMSNVLYWSSTPSDSDTNKAYSLYFNISNANPAYGYGRSNGLSVRLVQDQN